MKLYRICPGTFDEKIEKIKQQKQIRIILLVVCILIMLAGFIIAMWQKDYLLSMINPLELELVSESEIRGVSEVPEIHYIDFVKDYTDGSELILPDTVITGVGDYTLTYTVKSQTKETQRTMVLIIVDDISPVITLTSNSVTLEYGTTFDARSYLSSVTDNVDGDLMDSVEISSDVDTGTAGHYSVTYSVADSTGNTGQAVLNVTISPEPEPIVSPPSGGSSSSSSSGNMSGSNQSHASDPTAVSRTFYFSDYGSAEATLNAAQNYGRSALSAGQASHYTCNPIMQDGIYVGYQVIFFLEGDAMKRNKELVDELTKLYDLLDSHQIEEAKREILWKLSECEMTPQHLAEQKEINDNKRLCYAMLSAYDKEHYPEQNRLFYIAYQKLKRVFNRSGIIGCNG